MINHIKGLEINSIYDFDNSFSINELLCKFWEKIEETINISNESIDILEWVKNTGLSNETKLILEEWYNNGTLTQLINVEKFNNMKKEFTELVNEVNTKATPETQNANDGYRKFYDGLIVQWGTALIQSAGYIGKTSIIFPVPFGKVYNVIVGMEDVTSWMSVGVKEKNTSGFKVEARCHKGANDEKHGIGSVRINWIAVGGAQ